MTEADRERMDGRLRFSLLGEVGVERDGEAVALPASRKARALLGFLACTGRPHRRERLCEMFWDIPDDPRASLRWALSKLRQAVDEGPVKRIAADRERVSLELKGAEADYVGIRAQLFDNPPFIDPSRLREMAQALDRPLLDGLDHAGRDAFSAWLRAEREEAAILLDNVLRRIARHPETPPAEALSWARRWQEHAPFDPDAARTYLDLLRKTGRAVDADQYAETFRSRAEEAGVEVEELEPQRLEAPPETPAQEPGLGDKPRRRALRRQQIGFCHGDDGVRIAYATVGEGPPIVKAANWLNHLELDWDSPIWGRTFAAGAMGRTFIRYDERGNGLSDWDVDELSFETFVRDLETVVDALGLVRFPLLGISQGCAVCVEYAVRHPKRVSGLVLISGYATGWRIGASPEEQARREAVLTLTKHGWGTPNPAYRHIFSQTFMPDAKPEELDWFDEFQRLTTSPENAVRFQEAFGTIDVRDKLAHVRAPTIVFHSKDDQRITLEQGRELADGIPSARFVPLESRNHILLGHEPAWLVCRDTIREFLAEHGI